MDLPSNNHELYVEHLLLIATSLSCALKWREQLYSKWKVKTGNVSTHQFSGRFLSPRVFSAYCTPFSKSRRFLTFINAFLRLRCRKAWDGEKMIILKFFKRRKQGCKISQTYGVYLKVRSRRGHSLQLTSHLKLTRFWSFRCLFLRLMDWESVSSLKFDMIEFPSKLFGQIYESSSLSLRASEEGALAAPAKCKLRQGQEFLGR